MWRIIDRIVNYMEHRMTTPTPTDLPEALRTISEWPITDPGNMDAANMAALARAALSAAAPAVAPAAQEGDVPLSIACQSLPADLRDALHDVDDHIARMHGDDRGSFEPVNVLRRACLAIYRAAAPTAPQAGAESYPPSTVPQVVATAPQRIYLDLGFDPSIDDAPFSELHEITWSSDNASGHGIEYVRADTTTALSARGAAPSGWMPVPRAVYNALLAWHSPGGGDERDCAVLMDATSAMLAAAPQPPAALPGEQDARLPQGAEAVGDDGWPKLTADAKTAGPTFGKGVSARLLVEACYRRAAMETERRTMTPDAMRDEERRRRALWDMVHGPLDAAIAAKGRTEGGDSNG